MRNVRATGSTPSYRDSDVRRGRFPYLRHVSWTHGGRPLQRLLTTGRSPPRRTRCATGNRARIRTVVHCMWNAKTTVLIESVEHHLEEEEGEWFPKVRAALGRKQLAELGQRMLDAKKTGPRSPAQPSALKKAIDAVVK